MSEIYKCDVCGQVIQVLNKSAGTLVCCNKPMRLLQEKTIDAGSEKHVPIIKQEGSNVEVRIGSIPHPMTTEHYIQWIKIITTREEQLIKLKPGDEPIINTTINGEIIKVNAYCNKHELWANK